jgi:adenylate cyclase
MGAMLGLQAFALVTGQLAHAEQLAIRAAAIASRAGDVALEATANGALGYTLFFAGRLKEARAALETTEKAISLPGIPQDPRIVSSMLIAIIDWLRGDVDLATRGTRAALAEAEGMDGDRAAFTQAFVLTYLAAHAQMADDAPTASTYAQRAIEIASEHRFLQWLGAASLHLGAAFCALGKLDAGVPTLVGSLDAWRMAGAELMTPYFLARLGLAHLDGRAPADAVAVLDEALALATRTGEHVYDAELHRIRARARLEAGRPLEEVQADLDLAVDLAAAGGFRIYEVRALSDRVRMSDEPLKREAAESLAVALAWWVDRTAPADVVVARSVLEEAERP